MICPLMAFPETVYSTINGIGIPIEWTGQPLSYVASLGECTRLVLYLRQCTILMQAAGDR